MFIYLCIFKEILFKLKRIEKLNVLSQKKKKKKKKKSTPRELEEALIWEIAVMQI